ncbi:hypothetical protein VTL71DRAFT_9740 [Oculimacula yallundae]|uniref:Uncharacterized protein n=1 Tax=Oculimacula yallundae TaxID=86028 RepID=A0ABR4BRW3_9HELO
MVEPPATPTNSPAESSEVCQKLIFKLSESLQNQETPLFPRGFHDRLADISRNRGVPFSEVAEGLADAISDLLRESATEELTVVTDLNETVARWNPYPVPSRVLVRRRTRLLNGEHGREIGEEIGRPPRAASRGRATNLNGYGITGARSRTNNSSNRYRGNHDARLASRHRANPVGLATSRHQESLREPLEPETESEETITGMRLLQNLRDIPRSSLAINSQGAVIRVPDMGLPGVSTLFDLDNMRLSAPDPTNPSAQPATTSRRSPIQDPFVTISENPAFNISETLFPRYSSSAHVGSTEFPGPSRLSQSSQATFLGTPGTREHNSDNIDSETIPVNARPGNRFYQVREYSFHEDQQMNDYLPARQSTQTMILSSPVESTPASSNTAVPTTLEAIRPEDLTSHSLQTATVDTQVLIQRSPEATQESAVGQNNGLTARLRTMQGTIQADGRPPRGNASTSASTFTRDRSLALPPLRGHTSNNSPMSDTDSHRPRLHSSAQRETRQINELPPMSPSFPDELRRTQLARLADQTAPLEEGIGREADRPQLRRFPTNATAGSQEEPGSIEVVNDSTFEEGNDDEEMVDAETEDQEMADDEMADDEMEDEEDTLTSDSDDVEVSRWIVSNNPMGEDFVEAYGEDDEEDEEAKEFGREEPPPALVLADPSKWSPMYVQRGRFWDARDDET